MAGLIDWTTGINRPINRPSIGLYNRCRLARLARKPRRCNMPLATEAVKAQLPSTPTNKNKIRGGALRQGQTGALWQSSKLGFLFPSTPRYIQKESGKRARKRYGQLDGPRPGVGTLARKNPTPPTTTAHTAPPPSLPSASHLLIHGHVFGCWIKKNLVCNGRFRYSSKRETEPIPGGDGGNEAIAAARGDGDGEEYSPKRQKNYTNPASNSARDLRILDEPRDIVSK
jgi:hypothetical protein